VWADGQAPAPDTVQVSCCQWRMASVYMCYRDALVPGPILLPTLVTVLSVCKYSMEPGMWMSEVPILSYIPLMPFKSFGGWREVHRSGWLWKRVPSLGFLVGCWIAFQTHVCRYPLDVNFIQRADGWQNSPNETKRRVCLAWRTLRQTLDERFGIGEDSDALTSTVACRRTLPGVPTNRQQPRL